MQHFSNKTLNGKYFKNSQNLIGIVQLTDILFFIENWYEERLYIEQTYQKKPDLKIVSISPILIQVYITNP